MAHKEKGLATHDTRARGDRSSRDVAILARVGRSLLETLDLDEQLGLTLGLATEALEADRGSVLMLDTDSEALVIRAAEGLPDEARRAPIPVGEGIAGWVAANNEAVVLHGDVEDNRFEGVNPTIESSLSLPLAVEGRVHGVLNLVRLSGTRFADDDLRLASSLADLAALAIEKARLYSVLREREALVSDLLAAAIQAQEQERKRVAADIHDGFLQDLTALFLKTENTRMLFDRGRIDEARTSLADIQAMLKTEANALRDYIFEVRPPSLDEVGLVPTLRAMVERLTKEISLDGRLEPGNLIERLPRPIETILYRVAQEALRNAAKHSDAKNVVVALERGASDVTLRVTDDGRGIDPVFGNNRRPGHFGIDTMRERVELAGGRFRIDNRPEGGTEVRAIIPVDAPGGTYR